MKKLTIKKGIQEYTLIIDYVKYCLGTNYIEKYNLKKLIREYFSGYKSTEYSLNNTGESKIYINDKELNKKQALYYYVSHQYSLSDDLKLTTKSLVSKYLEILISQTDNVDTISSINILLESFSMELDNDLIISRFITFTPKQFLKILIPTYYLEEEQANEYDLSYDEIIIFQLKIIDYISKHITQTVFCIIDIPELTYDIKEVIDNMVKCIILVLVSKYKALIDMKDIYLLDSYNIDLCNDEDLYDFFIQQGICTLEEARLEMQKMLLMEQEKFDMSIIKNK